VRLVFDVGEEGPIIGALQSLLDEGTQDDLEAHRELELCRRPTGQDSGPLEDVCRENEQDPRLVLEHRRLRCGSHPDDRPASGEGLYIRYTSTILQY